tara:strand:- start:7056 stop:8447 length:1392 start_codon:yes stop_codon:yes gene_type:complete
MFGDMKMWTGVVEDRNDPLFLNRVRVRIYGIHTHEKQMIATPDLPWSQVIMPVTSSSLSGLGTTTHGLVEGSQVVGFFRDKNKLDPIVTGTYVGIPQDFYRIDEQVDDRGTRTFTKIKRKATDGFNDPRLDTKDSYKDTPDGESPRHINRPHGLTLALDKSPRRDGETTGEVYPKKSYLNTSDVNLLARGDISYPRIVIEDNTLLEDLGLEEETQGAKELLAGEGGAEEGTRFETGKTGGMNNIVGPRDNTTYINPVYPFNHVHETESGHVIELDDTPDFERIHLYHRSGTRIEIANKGDYVEKVVRDKYSVVVGNDFVNITGDVVVNITGNAYMNVTGNTETTVGGDSKSVVTGNCESTIGGNFDGTIVGTSDILSQGKITITGNNQTEIISNTTITGKLHVTENVTAAKDITAQGEITDKGATLATHKHKYTGLAEGATGETEGPVESLVERFLDWLNPFD